MPGMVLEAFAEMMLRDQPRPPPWQRPAARLEGHGIVRIQRQGAIRRGVAAQAQGIGRFALIVCLNSA